MEKFVRYNEIFYDRCLAVQMTNSIQSLCLESMRDFDKVRTYAYHTVSVNKEREFNASNNSGYA